MRKKFLEYLKKNIVLFDGAMGTILYSRGIFINRCFDEINLSNPKLISEIHSEYIDAGADVIETNTFGANRYKLKAYDLTDKIYEINFQGAKIARKEAGDDIWVAGSVGPLGSRIKPWGKIKKSEAKEAFGEQISALAKGGIDIVILETFSDINEIKQGILAAQEVCSLPIIAQMTLSNEEQTIYGTSPEQLAIKLTELGADVIGLNCSVGPKIMLTALEKMIKVTNRPISVQPNAGFPRDIEGRNIYLSSPEYMAEYSKRFINVGVKIVGGCCGTTPEHIKTIRDSISSIAPKKKIISVKTLEKTEEIQQPVEPEKKSRFAQKIANGEFITTVEMVPPKGIDCKKAISTAKLLKENNVDGINIPDGPRALSRMSAAFLSKLILDEVGIEPVLHYTARDRNLLGIMSDFLGIHTIGIRNVLLITGDPPKMGDYPDATAVFDVDSIGLVNLMNSLNHGIDIGGNSIGRPAEYFIGVGVNPGALDMAREMHRFEQKLEAGAEYVITQPIFDVQIFNNFMNRIKQYDIPIIAGVWPLISLRNAEFMNNEIPEAKVSNDIMEKMRSAKSKEEARETGLNIARQTIREIYSQLAGIQVSMPFGNVKYPLKVLEIIPEIQPK